uniref:Uncharacterized protein n=1 Tax=Anguilla anguilla TaxID=7936 RepID=A0A0E9QXH7_ANGAN
MLPCDALVYFILNLVAGYAFLFFWFCLSQYCWCSCI